MNVVEYRRVSTEEQGRSGLGLEAQHASIVEFCRRAGRTIVAEFEDVESGATFVRRGLQAAVAEARRQRCAIVVAKIDRLSRDVADTALVMKRCKVIAVDAGDDTFVLGLLSLVAQKERELISARTRAALAAKRIRGECVGASASFCKAIGADGARRWSDQSQRRAEGLAWAVRDLADLPLRDVAAELTRRGIPTMRGGAWSANSARRLLDRLGLRTASQSPAVLDARIR